MKDGTQRVKVLDPRKLRRLRVSSGLTMTALAEMAQCTSAHIHYLENGRRDASPPQLARLARALGRKTTDLMPDETDGTAA